MIIALGVIIDCLAAARDVGCGAMAAASSSICLLFGFAFSPCVLVSLEEGSCVVACNDSLQLLNGVMRALIGMVPRIPWGSMRGAVLLLLVTLVLVYRGQTTGGFPNGYVDSRS